MMVCLGVIASVLAALLPSLIAIAVLWWLDRYEKEPLWLLSVIFFWGAVPTVIMALIAQIILDIPFSMLFGESLVYSLANMSFVAPLTEETFKGLIILIIFVLYRREFDSVTDGILYGALVGFGFSVVEDVLYLMSSLMEGGWPSWGTTALMRIGLYNLNHAMFTSFIGVGFGLARNSREWWKKLLFPLAGWLMAMTLHAIHNGGAVLAEMTSGISCLLMTLIDWMGVVILLAVVLISVQRESRWFEELLPEIQFGVITTDEYRIASSYRERLRRGWQVLFRYGPLMWFRWSKFVQTIVDLAYKKHQKRVAGEGEMTDQLIANLRQRIAGLRSQLPVVE